MEIKYFISNIKKSFFSGNAKTIVIALCTLIFLPLIIKKIGIDNYGILSLSMIFGGLFGSFELGISKTVTVLFSQSDEEKKGGIFSNALAMIVFLLLIFGLFFMLISNYFDIFGNQSSISDQLGKFILFTSYCSIVLILINNLLLSSLQGYFLNHFVDFGQIVFSISYYILLMITAYNSESIYLLILMPLFAYLIQATFLGLTLFFKTDLKIKKINQKTLKPMISQTIGFFKIGLTTIFLQPLNKYLLFYLTGSSSTLGLFDIALKLGNISSSLLNASTQPLLAIFSKMQNKKQDVNSLSSKIALFIFCQYLLGMIIFYFFGELITKYLLSEDSKILYYISFMLIGTIASTAIFEPFFKFLLSQNPPKNAFLSKLSFPIFNLIFLLTINHSSMLYKITIAYSMALIVSNFFTYFFYKTTLQKWN